MKCGPGKDPADTADGRRLSLDVLLASDFQANLTPDQSERLEFRGTYRIIQDESIPSRCRNAKTFALEFKVRFIC